MTNITASNFLMKIKVKTIRENIERSTTKAPNEEISDHQIGNFTT